MTRPSIEQLISAARAAYEEHYYPNGRAAPDADKDVEDRGPTFDALRAAEKALHGFSPRTAVDLLVKFRAMRRGPLPDLALDCNEAAEWIEADLLALAKLELSDYVARLHPNGAAAVEVAFEDGLDPSQLAGVYFYMRDVPEEQLPRLHFVTPAGPVWVSPKGVL